MIKLFKKSADNKVVVAEQAANLKGKTTNEIIEEIHESFYTEVDRLLASAKIANSLDTDKQDLLDKCVRLKSLGFKNTKEVKEAEAEIARLDALKAENEAKKTITEAINYFSFKYPNYKFITEESVKKICAKYGLVYGEISKYIGTVPDKNLKYIEDFKVAEEDECCVERLSYFSGRGNALLSEKYTNSKERSENIGKEVEAERNFLLGVLSGEDDLRFKRRKFLSDTIKSYDVCPLEIAAPLKDFNMTDSEVKDFKISKIHVPDPVVLKPVVYNKQKYYLIVTAWGLEASDELVVNQKMN